MDDDIEFERMVAANADDIRKTILRDSLRRMLVKVAALTVVIAVAFAVLAVFTGWGQALITLAVVVPLSIAYAWWDWNRNPDVRRRKAYIKAVERQGNDG